MKYAVNIVIAMERMCGNEIIIHFSQIFDQPKNARDPDSAANLLHKSPTMIFMIKKGY